MSVTPKIAKLAGWRLHLTHDEAERIRQLEAIIAAQLASLAPIKAERLRLMGRANMRMVRSGQTQRPSRRANRAA